jgi:hypothetical protein
LWTFESTAVVVSNPFYRHPDELDGCFVFGEQNPSSEILAVTRLKNLALGTEYFVDRPVFLLAFLPTVPLRGTFRTPEFGGLIAHYTVLAGFLCLLHAGKL